MLKYGSLTNPSVEITKEIRRIAKGGFDYVEVGIEGPEGMPAILLKKKKKIVDLIRKKGLFAIGHTAWWMELASPLEEIRQIWVDEAKRSVDAAEALDITLLNFHFNIPYTLYLLKPATKKEILDNMVKTMKEIVKYGKPKGINIMLENTPLKKRVVDLKDYEYVLDRTPGLGAHLDVAHGFVTGGMKYITSYIKHFKKGILHVHVSDNDGVNDLHAPIGEGLIDWEAVVKALKDAGYDRTVTFEVFTNERDIITSRDDFRRLWEGRK